jgi:WD40 repeat protein
VLTVTKDGGYVLGGGKAGHVYVWESRTGDLVTKNLCHHSSINAIDCSDDDALVCTGGDDSVVKLFEYECPCLLP